MISMILEIILIVLVIILNIFMIKFMRDLNKEFTNIYCRLWELERKNYKNENN